MLLTCCACYVSTACSGSPVQKTQASLSDIFKRGPAHENLGFNLSDDQIFVLDAQALGDGPGAAWQMEEERFMQALQAAMQPE